MDRDRVRVGAQRGREDEARLRRLLDAAEAAGEPERPDTLEDAPQPLRDHLVGLPEQLRDRRLPGLHLVEVDEARERAERATR